MSHYEARVAILYGDGRLNAFARNAGLGITGIYTRPAKPEVFVLTYKDGEHVTMQRVQEAMARAKAESEKPGSDTCILSYEVLDIVLVETTNRS